MIWEENSSNDFAVSSPPSQRAAAKADASNQRRKRYKSGRLDRKREKRRRSTTNRASRRKLDQTTRETVWGIERPKLAVYPLKFKRYFRLVQQASRKLLPFRAFFSIFDAAAKLLFYPSFSNRPTFPFRVDVAERQISASFQRRVATIRSDF